MEGSSPQPRLLRVLWVVLALLVALLAGLLVWQLLGGGDDDNAAGAPEEAPGAPRVVSVEVALRKAGERAPLSVMASDAYFPFPDGIQIAAQAGVMQDVPPGARVGGTPAVPLRQWLRQAAVLARLTKGRSDRNG